MNHIVYKITNLLNGKEYIGIHSTDNLNDGYMGSGSALKKAIKKHGAENFKKEILYNFKTRKEASIKERELVNEEYTISRSTYNIVLGGGTPKLPLSGESKRMNDRAQKAGFKSLSDFITYLKKYSAHLTYHDIENKKPINEVHLVFLKQYLKDGGKIDKSILNKCVKYQDQTINKFKYVVYG